jgi:bacterioferritin (cytochrome b1)
MSEPPLEIEQMPNDMLRVSLTLHGITSSCYVSSMHLVEEKRGQLKASIMRKVMASYDPQSPINDW